MRVGLETLPNRMTLRSATKLLSGFVVSISPVSSMFGAGGVVFQSRKTSRPCSLVSAERRIVGAANEDKTRTTNIRQHFDFTGRFIKQLMGSFRQVIHNPDDLP